MRFKVNVSGKGDKVVSVDGNEKLLGELLQEIAETFGIDMDNVISVRFGYPPQTVKINDESIVRPLEDIGLSSGEKIGVTLKNDNDMSNISPQNKQNNGEVALKDNQSSFVADDGVKWILQQHVVPDDNSCLFHAISYCMYKDISLSKGLRERVAKEIMQDKETYNEAILGKAPRLYMDWILQKDSWGGGIEIAILSKVLNVAVYVLDIDALKFEKFNEDKYDEFIIILFSGVHYDAIESTTKKTVFNVKTDEAFCQMVLACSLEIATKMKKGGKSFNSQKANIVCNICHKTFMGEREIAKHAESTGHTDFGQA
ncbi:similar to Saccharomyces cerevisiae YFL044C OTU1 Deubiquitylation enzyme that binds to the chaperone-ATPase Cdc48p [Maudiozyma barnettii]|uniref:Ubiquitin thioesterase OTU n=1 Tax=Maudiozyma barnettii TaxID=61262 RepID=A0A8H2VEK1_9SACH|nr:ubiquitin-specific protease OTU1 [Kazachstania barnettii]CAB4254149.1 similar to Saccharomyces cerevisiae YFL044C OTU1 Deubiquitylation enzyme that binds to the chaperone-ATPase Cdc48p [Kazachstania barnettii]CAD1781899.1 similar to Saccharomyces cerevisiae YFL044C OTU1 Deubiquitylation enzyme that binds to the chaperone-ATPase Cdc48p [Kazachstania barnettii]